MVTDARVRHAPDLVQDPANGLGAAAIGDTPGNVTGSCMSSTSTGSTDSFSYSPGLTALAVPDTGAFPMTQAGSYTLDAGGHSAEPGAEATQNEASALFDRPVHRP
jgi:hypothetical protein